MATAVATTSLREISEVWKGVKPVASLYLGEQQESEASGKVIPSAAAMPRQPKGDPAMTILASRAALAKAMLQQQAKTETQSEQELFEAIGLELDRQARRQRIVRLRAAAIRFWMGGLGRFTKGGQGQHMRKNVQ